MKGYEAMTRVMLAIVALLATTLPALAAQTTTNEVSCEAQPGVTSSCMSVIHYNGTKSAGFCRYGDTALPATPPGYVACANTCPVIELFEGYCCPASDTDEDCEAAALDCYDVSDCTDISHECRQLSELHDQGCEILQRRTTTSFPCSVSCNF